MRSRTAAMAIAAACVLAACQPAAPPADRSKQVTIAIPGDPVSLDPAQSLSAFDGSLLDLMYEQLTAVDPRSPNGAIVGELAERWEISPDGLSLTFTLRAGHAFDDGAPVTADAVKQSFDRVRSVGRNAQEGLYWLDRVEVVDAQTVRLLLKQPFPAAPAFLALPTFSIVNPAALVANAREGDEAKAWLAEHSAGSGSYTLKQWRRGQKILLQSNPHAAKAPQQFTEIAFAIVPNDSARRLQLEKGDVDYLSGLGATASRDYDTMKGVTLLIGDRTMDMRFITMNVERPPLNDPRVRQAIAAAIDYDALRDKVLVGRVGTIAGYLPIGVPGGDPALAPPKRDLERARRLLAEAGYKPDRELQMMVGAYGPVSEFIQAQLKEAGIAVALQRLAPSAIEAKRANGEFDLFYDGWVMDVPDPAIFFNLAFSSRYRGSGVNASRFATPELDAALDAALAQADPAAREAAYRKIEADLIAARPVAMLFATLPIIAHRDDLLGVQPNPYQTTYMNIQDWTRAPQQTR